MSYGGFYPPSRPRAVEGGLTARSARGEIGTSWWSRRFVSVLESFALGSRLTRGRNYARRGQVVSLEVVPGVVTARVQGSRATPYKVAIGFAPFTGSTWNAVDVALASQALFCAQLLAGEVPPELEDLLADVGAPLFPGAIGEVWMSCSCPDFAVPCKHLAATFYLLAERFDEDPFTMLLWRGRGREELLARVRELRSVRPAGGGVSGGAGSGGAGSGGTDGAAAATGLSRFVAGSSLALADLLDGGEAPEGPRDLDPAGYWHARTAPPDPVPSLDVPVDLLLRQLPDPPRALGGAALLERLRPVYLALEQGSTS